MQNNRRDIAKNDTKMIKWQKFQMKSKTFYLWFTYYQTQYHKRHKKRIQIQITNKISMLASIEGQKIKTLYFFV